MALNTNPPFDDSDPCPACPMEARGLYAVVANYLTSLDRYRAGNEDPSRFNRKEAELREQYAIFSRIVDKHFADPRHSNG